VDKEIKKELAVRVIYIVPKDAEPWGDAKRRATQWLEDIQWFFADEMERLGYGRKTFEIARDERGELIFHQISSLLTKEEFGKNRVKNCIRAAQAKGLESRNDVVIYFYETYDGNASSQGTRGGRKGVFLGSLYLKRAKREWIANDNKYDGEISDWRGRKLGDLSGEAYGVMAHELGHPFGLSNDKPAGRNRKGNLMGNGCQGMRGYFRRDLTGDFCFLSKENAAILEKSDFFSVRRLKPKSTVFGQAAK
jgi:hypothetical protein